MQSDQSVSLRPGGGKGRTFAPRSSTSSSSASSALDPLPAPRLSHDGKGMDLKAQNRECIQYTRDELYKLGEIIIDIPQDIAIAKSEMEAEILVAEEQEWARPVTNALPSATRYLEPDSRDWKTRSALPSLFEEEDKEEQLKEVGRRSEGDWRGKELEHDASSFQISSRQQELPSLHQYSRQQESSTQYPRQQELQPSIAGVDRRPSPAIVRASNPWSARKGAVSEKDKVLRVVKGILNKLTPDKFEVLLGQLLNAGIDSADILKGVISLVFDKAVLEPTFCPMYAQLCVHLSKELPEFSSDEDDGKPVTFRRILLNSCQIAFEGADNMRAEIRQMTKPEQELERSEKEKLLKLRTLGNIKLIGELFKQKMIPEKIVHHCIHSLLGTDTKNPPAEENVEALCQLLYTVGKQLDESAKSKNAIDSYLMRLKELATNSRLPPRIRFMVRDTVDLRTHKWVPRRAEVKAKKINEIHAEAEQTLGLRPGVTGLRNGRGSPGVMGMPGIGNNFALSRPGSMMPGMPGLLPVSKMPGAAPLMPGYIPVMESEGWETFSIGRKSKIGKEGLVPTLNMIPGRTVGIPTSGPKPNSASSKLLLQGSGSSFLGRPSALLSNSSAKPVAPILGQNAGILQSTSQGEHGVSQRNFVGILEQERVAGPPKQTGTEVSLYPAALSKKAESLLKEYLSVVDLKEAMLCVEELQSPDFHPQVVERAILMGLQGQERDRELIRNLLEYLYSRRVVSGRDVGAGIMLVVEPLDDLAIDIPIAPRYIGDLIGTFSLSGVVDLRFLVDVIRKTEDPQVGKTLYDAALMAINFGPNSEKVLMGQSAELQECRRLFEMARM